MIFRHFAHVQCGSHSYLIASAATRQAAIVNPTLEGLEAYRAVIAQHDLRLVYTLRTHKNGRCGPASRELEQRYGAQTIAPAGTAAHGSEVEAAIPGRMLSLGELRIEVIEPPPGYSGEVAYRTSSYTFAGTSVLVDFHAGPTPRDGEPDAILDATRPAALTEPTTPSPRPIESFRGTREGVPVERLILEDLNESLAEGRFTRKEERAVRAYIEAMEAGGFEPPSAGELSRRLGNVDRTAVHVLVHNVRWKQIELGRLPLLLAGQTSKWLRGLRTRPDFTPHEREFLTAYLRLVEEKQAPPSGPEIARALGGRRNIQWVRKRAHTIRGKQREFGMPELLLSRQDAPPSPQRGREPRTRRAPQRGAPAPAVA